MKLNLEVNTEDFDAKPEDLIESLGALPHWVLEFNLLNGDDLKKYLDMRYGFGLYEFGGAIDEEGTYVSAYKEDENLPYVAKMGTAQGTVYFYPYAIIGIPTSNGYFITRMD